MKRRDVLAGAGFALASTAAGDLHAIRGTTIRKIYTFPTEEKVVAIHRLGDSIIIGTQSSLYSMDVEEIIRLLERREL